VCPTDQEVASKTGGDEKKWEAGNKKEKKEGRNDS
jgi:hypothetical protein